MEKSLSVIETLIDGTRDQEMIDISPPDPELLSALSVVFQDIMRLLVLTDSRHKMLTTYSRENVISLLGLTTILSRRVDMVKESGSSPLWEVLQLLFPLTQPSNLDLLEDLWKDHWDRHRLRLPVLKNLLPARVATIVNLLLKRRTRHPEKFLSTMMMLTEILGQSSSSLITSLLDGSISGLSDSWFSSYVSSTSRL